MGSQCHRVPDHGAITRRLLPHGASVKMITRGNLLSVPYPFASAQEHYEALLEETTQRGGPTEHTYATVPGEVERDLPASGKNAQ